MKLWVVAVACFVIAATGDNRFDQQYRHVINMLKRNATFKAELEANFDIFSGLRKKVGVEFPCQILPPSPTVPTSVHKLRPGDIKVVAALGDSLTAAKGATAETIFGMLFDNRGVSWSIGGDGTFEDQKTLPNILKKYNPDIKGFSVGTGSVWGRNSHLNQAVSGAFSAEVVDQAHRLIHRMKKEKGLDFENDWKVITLMVGGNDLCDSCDNPEGTSSAVYTNNIKTVLDILHAEVPRAFVNLVEVMNMQMVTELNRGLLCTVVHLACPCAAFPINDKAEAKLVALTKEYQSDMTKLVETGRYDTRDDFTVVVQPFLHDTYTPKKEGQADLSYFAPDCFHLSAKGQGVVANGLWGNMIEPVGEKKVTWSPGEPVECPTEKSPYFFTRKNSPTRNPSNKSFLKKGNTPGNNAPADPEHTNPEIPGVVTAFIVLGVVGLVLTGVWAWHRRRQYSALKYNRMTKESMMWEDSPDIMLMKPTTAYS